MPTYCRSQNIEGLFLGIFRGGFVSHRVRNFKKIRRHMKKIPSLAMLKSYRSKMRFHTPGHKGRLYALRAVSRLDITELPFSDDIIFPHGEICELNRRLSAVYGEYSRVMTGGATGGIFAMLSNFRNKRVLASRFSHRSIFAAMHLFGIEPVLICDFIAVNIPEFPMYELKKHVGEVDAVILTYPDYYGRTFDIERIYAICVKNKKPLLIDSAHGGHYAYGTSFPPNAAKFSDMCVFGVHKTCLAMTGAAVACAKKDYIMALDRGICECLSSSPSYPVCVSVDISHAFMVEYYSAHMRKLSATVASQREKLKARGITVLENGDAAKLVIDVSALGISGFDCAATLYTHGIVAEMADFNRVVFILTLADSVKKVRRLLAAIAKIPRGDSRKALPPESIAIKKLPFGFDGETQRVLLTDAENRVSAGSVGLYPPGVPLVLSGDVITYDIIKLLDEYSEYTFGLFGAEIEVFKE